MAKILVIRLAAIADVAMTLPVIYSAAKANPQDSFTVLTQAFMMPVFMNRPSNLEVIGISTKGAEKTLLGLLRFTSALVKFDYDIVLDLQDVIRTWIICAAFRMKGKPVYVLDKIRKKYPPLMRRENKKLEPLPTVIERYADVFRAAGLAYTESFTSLYESRPADLSKMEAIAGVKTGKWLGVAPFARYQGKVYPIDEMEQVVATLSKREDLTLFLFVGVSDAVIQAPRACFGCRSRNLGLRRAAREQQCDEKSSEFHGGRDLDGLLLEVADFVRFGDAGYDFDVHAVRQTERYVPFLEGLFGALLRTGEDIDAGLALFELDGAFGQCENTFAAVGHDAGIGAVTCTDEDRFRDLGGGLHLEHDDPVHIGGFGRNVLQRGLEDGTLHGTDGQHDGHAGVQAADVGFIDIAPEEHVAHVGDRGDRGAVVEGIGLDHRVADLDRYVEDHTRDGGAYLGVA